MTRSGALPVHLDRRRSVALHVQLAGDLKVRIRSGLLTPGTELPSTREFARDLGVSRNTIIAAYDQLLGEGYLESRARSGVRVSPELAGRIMTAGVSNSAAGSFSDGRSVDATFRLRGPLPFRPCQPDVRLFPLPLWNRLRSHQLREAGTALLDYQSGHALGLPSLRRAIAEYLRESRGVHCHWSRVAITGGSQHALFLLSLLLLKPEDRVLLEDPGYPGARQAFTRCGAKLVSLPVDAEGAVPPVRVAPAALIYTTPSRQFPTGACMPVARRMAMLEYAATAKAWLLEDDYDSEFRYARPPVPGLHSLDSGSRVIYIGSMSKVLFPSLRIGYVVLPDSLITPFESLRLTVDDHGPLIDQATLAEFMEAGAFYRHIRRCRKVYASRLDAFLGAVHKQRLPLTFPCTDGGMNLAATFDDTSFPASRFSLDLSRNGLHVPALEDYCLHASTAGLLFGFTAFSPALIRASVSRFAEIFRSFQIPRSC